MCDHRDFNVVDNTAHFSGYVYPECLKNLNLKTTADTQRYAASTLARFLRDQGWEVGEGNVHVTPLPTGVMYVTATISATGPSGDVHFYHWGMR